MNFDKKYTYETVITVQVTHILITPKVSLSPFSPFPCISLTCTCGTLVIQYRILYKWMKYRMKSDLCHWGKFCISFHVLMLHTVTCCWVVICSMHISHAVFNEFLYMIWGKCWGSFFSLGYLFWPRLYFFH